MLRRWPPGHAFLRGMAKVGKRGGDVAAGPGPAARDPR
jgi:hypothetical protein